MAIYLCFIFLMCYVQRKDYDAALVAAFRREQETEAKLKAMIAAKLVAEQLVCICVLNCDFASTFCEIDKTKVNIHMHLLSLIICGTTGNSKSGRGQKLQDEASFS